MISIDDLAAYVDADLRALSDRWLVEIVAVEGEPDQVRKTAASHGLSIPELFPQAVSIRHDGFPYSQLILQSGPDDQGEQLKASIEQLKAFVAEKALADWPRCPGHPHALVPVHEVDMTGWFCPSSTHVLVQLGCLSHLDQ